MGSSPGPWPSTTACTGAETTHTHTHIMKCEGEASRRFVEPQQISPTESNLKPEDWFQGWQQLLYHLQLLPQRADGSLLTGNQFLQVLVPQLLPRPALSGALTASLQFGFQVDFCRFATTFARFLHFTCHHLTTCTHIINGVGWTHTSQPRGNQTHTDLRSVLSVLTHMFICLLSLRLL